MATERALNCSPCDYKHETTPAVKWCVDCAEALCATCLDVHKGLKVTRNHNVFGIEDHSTLQGIMLDLSETQRCEQHDNTSEYFCPLHDQIICIKCIQTKHIRCTGWLPISEAADGVKSSVAKETIKQDLDDVIRNVEKLIDSYEKERISNQTQKELSSNIDNRKTELLGKLHKLKQLKDKLNGIEGYASDTQLFLSIRRMSKQLSDFIIEVKSLTEDPLILLKELKLAKPVRSFLSDVTLFGHVHSDRKLISFQSTKLQKIQSHISVSFSQTIEIQDVIKFNVSKLESKSMKLWSAVILPNKQLIFKWDKSKNFVIHTLDGKFVTSVCA
ncbi:unnamed protein product [Mytilus edulis]|uniref:B box-type domain-containing protein n=1 Tax=Mytilus edulis TaxID=6550 RepID=A0A8S3Q9Y9_MYTED|nr:unnamed protein product [Mytilus edulis]